MSIPFLQKMLK